MLMPSKIRLLIVDDSALMRKHLSSIFMESGEFEIATARNGKEAVVQQLEFKPDVITLDVNMPEMDGLTALSMLMAQAPTPVVMVSSLTEKGAMATLEALALGAVDFVPKPGGTISLSIDAVRTQLLEKVRGAVRYRSRIRRHNPTQLRHDEQAEQAEPSERAVAHAQARVPVTRQSVEFTTWPFGVVCIGVSTGGPRALESILPALPADFPWPILIAQHMPPMFTQAFASRLNTLCAIDVVEVSAPMPLKPGVAYIGMGGSDMLLTRRLGQLYVTPKPENPALIWHPSVEALMDSVAGLVNPNQVIGVMLTGMGYDGSHSMAALKKAGARTVAESETSATVFGMPAELIKKDGASVVLPIDQIAQQLKTWLGLGGNHGLVKKFR